MLKKLLFIVTLALIPCISHAAEQIPSNKVAFHVGETLMVCGKVAAVSDLNKRVVINLGKDYPNEDIGLLIWNTDKAGFEQRFGNLSNLKGYQVCATGTIEVYKDHPQMKLSNSMMLRLMK